MYKRSSPIEIKLSIVIYWRFIGEIFIFELSHFKESQVESENFIDVSVRWETLAVGPFMCRTICRVQTKRNWSSCDSHRGNHQQLFTWPQFRILFIVTSSQSAMEWSAKWENEIIYDRQSKSGMSDAYLNEDNEFWIKELLKFPKLIEIYMRACLGIDDSWLSTEKPPSSDRIRFKFSYFIMIYQFWIYDNWLEINSLGRQKKCPEKPKIIINKSNREKH